MRGIRALAFVGFTAGWIFGCLLLGSGCGDAASSNTTGMVKDAPPLSPDQQKVVDQYYKKTPSKKASN